MYEIKLSDCAPAGWTPPESVHPEMCARAPHIRYITINTCVLPLKMRTPGVGCMLNLGIFTYGFNSHSKFHTHLLLLY